MECLHEFRNFEADLYIKMITYVKNFVKFFLAHMDLKVGLLDMYLLAISVYNKVWLLDMYL